MRRLRRMLAWVLVGLGALGLLAGGTGYLWLRSGLPQLDGHVQVAGLAAPVEIVRDSDGVPHIRGQSEADALFGLGYAHAQDRLWQMELQRRAGTGRLSEVLGASTLSSDRLMRAVGIGRAAQLAWHNLAPPTQRLIESYVAGINAFLASHHGRHLPVEFALLGFEPEPWQPTDVVVWSKMMAWTLASNGASELVQWQVAAAVGPARAAELRPTYDPSWPLILADGGSARPASPPPAPVRAGSRQPAISELVAAHYALYDLLGMDGISQGSNNWVLSGARSTTGKPLLANDPHLAAQLPSTWYLAHVTGGALDVIGASIPGLPAVVVGHNRRIAWGVTNTGADVQDYYIERLNERNQYEDDGVWRPLRVISETLRIKGQPDQILQIRSTHHGPLLTDYLTNVSEPVALSWVGSDPQDGTLGAFLGINMASDWESFTGALAGYLAPMQNFVYADLDGNIGFYAPGALPIRAGGDGLMPVPGWTRAADWQGYVPFEQLPHTYNPPQGYIASANNKVAPDSYPYLITNRWDPPYRIMRITELLAGAPQHSPEDFAAMQADQRSALARRLLPTLLQATPPDERARAAIELLHGWDGTLSADSPQAAIYAAWYYQLGAALFADELGEPVWRDYRRLADKLGMVIDRVLQDPQSPWCDNVTTPLTEDCRTTLGQALAAGLAAMAQQQGHDTLADWRWGRVHQVTFGHLAFGTVAPLGAIFNRAVPTGGDDTTLNYGLVSPSSHYRHISVAGYRQIIDLADFDRSRFITAVGQSGQLLSPLYDNLAERWRRVEYLPMHYSATAVSAAAAHRLTLLP